VSAGQVQEYGDRQWLERLWLEEAPLPTRGRAGDQHSGLCGHARSALAAQPGHPVEQCMKGRAARGNQGFCPAAPALRADSHGVVYLAYQSLT
jgi:hypothetical protein